MMMLPTTTTVTIILLLFIVIVIGTVQSRALDEHSVVLITGAAGHLGSELALALYELFDCHIIGVDSMDKGFGQIDKDLSIFEFKRQRLFRLLQTIPSHRMSFYRVDLRPSLPQFFDSSEVPVLNHIFMEPITHVVHLADHVHRTTHSNQNNNKNDNPPDNNHDPQQQQEPPVIPRLKGQEKAGMMEALLEQLVLTTKQSNDNAPPPHFVYASSGDVYNHHVSNNDDNHHPNTPPFSEDQPITTPSSALGTSKLVDEILAQAYNEEHHVASIGLRYFEIYGPWGRPGSLVFELAEASVLGKGDDTNIHGDQNNQLDFLYIDDAIDATIAAMQFDANRRAIVFNVGSGVPSSLSSVASTIRNLVQNVPEQQDDDTTQEKAATIISYADTKRPKKYLNFQPQVSLSDGLAQVLAWHYDRAFPYGTSSDSSNNNKNNLPASTKCDLYDTQCLRGTPVFPCASECSHPDLCKSTLWDDVLPLSRTLTADCETVLYTVDLDPNASTIPSAFVRVSTQSVAYVTSSSDSTHCNIAFVSHSSPLYRLFADKSAPDGVAKHGFWGLVPVAVSEFAHHQVALLSMLPKVSPGSFFGDSVSKAVYVDPNVVIDNLPRLLKEADMQPAHSSVQGETVLLIGKQPLRHTPAAPTRTATPPKVLQQESAYRMIRIAIIDELSGDGFAQRLDSSFLVHRLPRNDNDGRLFRCDVFGEILQWEVDTDTSALEFIIGLHDMWSRVMVKRSGMDPWWVGEEVDTVPVSATHRRLQEVVEDKGQDPLAMEDSNEDDKIPAAEETEDGAQQQQQQEHNGFGVQDAFQAVFGTLNEQKQQQRFDRPETEEKQDDFVVVDDDDTTTSVEDEPEDPQYYLPREDPSKDDVWMGVLSSSLSIRYFTRLVSPADVGLYWVNASEMSVTPQE